MKNSKKRNKIIEIFQKGDLLTANEVCEKLPELDRATIYRNLNTLSELGILREVNVRKGISSYEIAKKDDFHQHFVCVNCEKIIPVDIKQEDIKKLLPKISFDAFELNLRGTCSVCEAKNVE